jgi:integrase
MAQITRLNPDHDVARSARPRLDCHAGIGVAAVDRGDRGRRRKTGKTPVLEGEEWRKLLASIPTTTLRDLRDRALIATLTYSFARISAALKMKVEDLRPQPVPARSGCHQLSF